MLNMDIPFFGLVTLSEAALGIVADGRLENGLSDFGGRVARWGRDEGRNSNPDFCLLNYTET